MTEEGNLQEVTIQGLIFDLSMPYAEGHVLTAGEASQLNQVRFENIRNNFASVVRKAIEDYRKTNNLPEDSEVALTELDTEDLQEKLSEYDKIYEMGVRSGPSGPRASRDPVTREAEKIALEKVRAAIKKQGISLNSVSKEKYAELTAAVIGRYPEIKEEAQRRVNAAAGIALDSLKLA